MKGLLACRMGIQDALKKKKKKSPNFGMTVLQSCDALMQLSATSPQILCNVSNVVSRTLAKRNIIPPICVADTVSRESLYKYNKIGT